MKNPRSRALRLENVAFRYPGDTGARVFESLSAEFPVSGATVVLGANASGKTTLARLVSSLDSPQRGTVGWSGDSERESRGPTGRARLSVGVVFEQPDFQFHTPSVKEELTVGLAHLGAPAGRREAALDLAARRYGMAGWLSSPVHSLSAPEKLAVLCAAFLLLEPELLVLDFSLGDLDESFRAALLEQVRGTPGTGLVVLTRSALDLAFLENGDRVYILSRGALEPLENPENQTQLVDRLSNLGINLPWYLPLTGRLYREGLLDRLLFAGDEHLLGALRALS